MPVLEVKSYNARAAAEHGKKLTIVDRLILLRSDPHTHTELKFSERYDNVSFSATMQDGSKCARFKHIAYSHPERWTTHCIVVTEEQEGLMYRKALELKGKKYGLWDLLSFGTPLRIIKPHPDKYWCTEAVAAALNAGGIETPRPDTLHPQGLVEWLDDNGYERKGFCEYTNMPCDFWDPDDLCLALDPTQCPYNNQNDIEAIKAWQTRTERR